MSLSVVDTPRKESVTTDTVCKKRKTDDTTSIITAPTTAIAETQKMRTKEQKEARLELSRWISGFERRFELEMTREVDCDAPGDIVWEEAGKEYVCPLTSMMYLLDNVGCEDDVEAVGEFVGEEYINDFPKMLEKLAGKLLEGASIARRAGCDLLLAEEVEDDEEDEDDEDEE
jgi:hypothetical protein